MLWPQTQFAIGGNCYTHIRTRLPNKQKNIYIYSHTKSNLNLFLPKNKKTSNVHSQLAVSMCVCSFRSSSITTIFGLRHDKKKNIVKNLVNIWLNFHNETHNPSNIYLIWGNKTKIKDEIHNVLELISHFISIFEDYFFFLNVDNEMSYGSIQWCDSMCFLIE